MWFFSRFSMLLILWVRVADTLNTVTKVRFFLYLIECYLIMILLLLLLSIWAVLLPFLLHYHHTTLLQGFSLSWSIFTVWCHMHAETRCSVNLFRTYSETCQSVSATGRTSSRFNQTALSERKAAHDDIMRRRRGLVYSALCALCLTPLTGERFAVWFFRSGGCGGITALMLSGQMKNMLGRRGTFHTFSHVPASRGERGDVDRK